MKSLTQSDDDLIKSAKAIKYYYRGGKEVISIMRNGDLYTVYEPPFAHVPDIANVVRGLKEDIDAEIKECLIKDKDCFLFDIFTKKIVMAESFIDWIPYYGVKNAIISIEGEDGTIEGCVRYLSDKSDYGALRFLTMAIAKRELLSPKDGIWTRAGKMLLTYLTSNRYSKPHTFKNEGGLWDGMILSFNKKAAPRLPVELKDLKIDKAIEIAQTIAYLDDNYDATVGAWYEYTDEEDSSAFSGIRLSELLRIGINSFFGGQYKILDVEIDIMRDKFSSIVLDGENKACYVSLAKGCTMTDERAREDLQSEYVKLVTDLV